MSKVKVRQEQFDWLEKYKNDEEIDYAINIQPFNKRPDSPIADWSASKLARSLHIGYEVEPIYKVDQWIKSEGSQIGKITKIDEHGWIHTDFGEIITKEFYRRIIIPTLEEIATEKQRRFWDRNGRKPGEVKRGDQLVRKDDTKDFVIVSETYEDHSVGLYSIKKSQRYGVNISAIIARYRVVCFAEDRKDMGEIK